MAARVLAVLLLSVLALSALAQLPVIQCSIHNVPAYFTGQVRYVDSRPAAYEYRHDSHSFWTRCQ
jgi:hypothetical protein